MWVLLPFNGDQIHQVIRTAGYPKEALKESKIGLLRIKLALQSGGLALHNPEIGLTPKMVASTLEVITPILKRRGPDEWRAWAGLGHLALFRWFDNSHPRSSETGLEGALTQLCGFMEENVNSFRGRWEIAGVLARCAEFGCLETIQRKLLEILYRMPDGRVSGRKSPRFHLWSYEAGQVGQLFEIARKAGEPAFFGFLKFFFYLNQIAEMSEGYGKIQIPRLNFDAKHIMSLVERSQGSIREGALLLLTSGDSLPFADTIRLLEFSKSDYKPVGRSWAKLVIETIRDLYDPAATDFIEAILSSAAKYPRAVKYAALGKYLQIATATTVDIKSQEEKLGLPFQPIS